MLNDFLLGIFQDKPLPPEFNISVPNPEQSAAELARPAVMKEIIMQVSRQRGFTLIEVILVLTILALLAGLAVVAIPRIQESSNKKAAFVLVKGTCEAVDLYHTQMNRYPASDEGLKALVEAPSDEKLLEKWNNSSQPFLKDGVIPKDPWENELKYELVAGSEGASSGPAYHVWSAGPDMTDNTDDDIRSWTEAAK